MMWRLKLGAFCRMFHLNEDNYKARLKEWFGRNWIYRLRPLIESIKPREFFSEVEARASLVSAWIVAVNERERRRYRKRSQLGRRQQPVLQGQPQAWASWIERTKEEAA